MALQQTVTAPNGTSGNYIRICGSILYNPDAKEAQATFTLFSSSTTRAAGLNMALGVVATLNLDGAKFDEYLSVSAMAALIAAGGCGGDTIRDQLYAASKVEPLQPGLGLASISFASATNV